MKPLRYLFLLSVSLVIASAAVMLPSVPALAVSQADFSSIYNTSATNCGNDLTVDVQKSDQLFATYNCLHLVNNVSGSYVIKSAPSGSAPCPQATISQLGGGTEPGVAVNKGGQIV